MKAEATVDDVVVGSVWRGVLECFRVVEVDDDRARLVYVITAHNEPGEWWETKQDIASAFDLVSRPRSEVS